MESLVLAGITQLGDKFCITWAERSFVSHFVSRNGKRSAHNIYTRKDAFPSHQDLKVMKNSSHV